MQVVPDLLRALQVELRVALVGSLEHNRAPVAGDLLALAELLESVSGPSTTTYVIKHNICT